ncbi:unnamed protein product [Blepharisma stoltei]|uniref:VWFA domain-containing protein n=1 Tax=Blepharisma stoltei TaxID=1481888 RepID=A0AAU9J280_9CILI|nr:unnamed protein product [Blepharisma stoltei]
MAVMSACGGDSCKAHRASNVDLSEIFERISIGIGIIKQTQAIGVTDCTNASLMIHEQSAPVLTMRRNRFAVLLNLDFSNSMDGANWNSLKSSVAMFLRSLQEGDIVSCLLFNHKVMLLSEMNIPACLPPASSSARNFSSPSYNPIQSSISPPKQASGKAINSGTDSSAVNCKCNLV